MASTVLRVRIGVNSRSSTARRASPRDPFVAVSLAGGVIGGVYGP
jgi:hypothetical protein